MFTNVEYKLLSIWRKQISGITSILSILWHCLSILLIIFNGLDCFVSRTFNDVIYSKSKDRE